MRTTFWNAIAVFSILTAGSSNSALASTHKARSEGFVSSVAEQLFYTDKASPTFKRLLWKNASNRAWLDATHTWVLLFETNVTDEDIAHVNATGATVEVFNNKRSVLGRLMGVHATIDQLGEVARRRPSLVQIEHPSGMRGEPTGSIEDFLFNFNVVDDLLDLSVARHRLDDNGEPITGRNQVVGCFDTDFDVFHPLFFFADGGAYSWLDTDGDGVFTPSVDGVDIDHNLDFDMDEVGFRTGGFDAGWWAEDRPDEYIPRTDWIFVDVDGNGKRDFGQQAGYGDQDLAFGEPLFIGDDVNSNGTIDVGEKFIRLGTSKIRAVFAPQTGEVHERGENLSEVQTDGWAYHGTSAASLLVGGHRFLTSVVGVAPDAELVLVAKDRGDSELDTLQTSVAAATWALDQGSEVINHSYGRVVGDPSDGSSALEATIDELTASGAPQIVAAGNQGNWQNFATSVLSPNQPVTISLDIHESPYDSTLPVSYLTAVVRWVESNGDVEVTVEAPNGFVFELDGVPFWEDPSATVTHDVYQTSTTTARGTRMLRLSYARVDGDDYVPLNHGQFTFTLTNHGDTDVTTFFRAYAGNWGESVTVHPGTGYEVGPQGTATNPATADSAITVSASIGTWIYAGESWDDLHLSSSQGPRIDGNRTIDIASPTNSASAYESEPGSHGDYVFFGKTSGAAPLVAGGVLLAKAMHSESATQLKQRVQNQALEDNLTGPTPNNAWGHGRFNMHKFLWGEEAPDNSPPMFTLTTATAVLDGTAVVDLSSVYDESTADSELTFFIDVEYDGTVDVRGLGPIQDLGELEIGEHTMPVEVFDADGGRTRRLVRVNVVDVADIPAETGEESAADDETSDIDDETGDVDGETRDNDESSSGPHVEEEGPSDETDDDDDESASDGESALADESATDDETGADVESLDDGDDTEGTFVAWRQPEKEKPSPSAPFSFDGAGGCANIEPLEQLPMLVFLFALWPLAHRRRRTACVRLRP